MAGRSSSRVLISIPPLLLAKIDAVAQEEYRNRSEVIREALRRYMREWQKEHIEEER